MRVVGDGDLIIKNIGLYINENKAYEIEIKELGDRNLSAEDLKELEKVIDEELLNQEGEE